jgi:hypothetical protein
MRLPVSLALVSVLLVTPAWADTGTLTPAEAHAVVEAELDLVAKNYVFPEKRDAIVAAIRARQKAGAYDVANPGELADRLGGDVIAASHDKHMWIQYDPAQYAALIAPQTGGDDNAYVAKLERSTNYGYAALKVLPGNVRYLNLVNFGWEADTPPAAVADAVRYLAGGDAAIIDLRQNGGGSGAAVRAIVSYFMPDKPQLLMNFHDGEKHTVEQTFVDLKLAGPRMAGKPLYVLTSGGTGSAAEEFAYHVKMFKLGTLVGETTAGAANNDSIFPIPPGFAASISTGRAVHPVSNTNWEGTGVAPDVAVDAGKALEKAQLLALQHLAAMPGADAGDYAWAMTGLAARAVPLAKLDAAATNAYVGSYGVRRVFLVDGTLTFQREGRPPLTMMRYGDDLFSLGDDDNTRVQFQRKDGKITGFDMSTADGQHIAVARTK